MASDVDTLRALLADLQLSQRTAARLLRFDQRDFRRICKGEIPVPPWMFARLRDRLAQQQAQPP